MTDKPNLGWPQDQRDIAIDSAMAKEDAELQAACSIWPWDRAAPEALGTAGVELTDRERMVVELTKAIDDTDVGQPNRYVSVELLRRARAVILDGEYSILAAQSADSSNAAPVDDSVAFDMQASLEWTPEQALRFYADGRHFDTVNGRTRIIDTGAVASHALKSSSPEYRAMKGAEVDASNAATPEPAFWLNAQDADFLRTVDTLSARVTALRSGGGKRVACYFAPPSIDASNAATGQHEDACGLDGLVCEHCGNGHTVLTFEDGQFACNCDDCCADCQYFAIERINQLLAAPAAPSPKGEVVVTRNDAGAIVAVTRQDDEGRILSVIAEAVQPPGEQQ